MIYETRPGSSWAPYMDVFPKDFDTLIYWSDDELHELRGSDVLQRIGREAAEEGFREELLPLARRYSKLFEGTCLDYDNLEESLIAAAHRMATIIMSYSFDVQPPEFVSPAEDSDEDMDDDEPDFSSFFKGLVPFADMLNSDADIFNARIFQSPTALEVITLRDIRPGEELLNDYGDLPRADLLRRYGYVTPNYAQYDLADLPAAAILSACAQAFGTPDSTLKSRANFLLEVGVLEESYDIDADFAAPSNLFTSIKMLTMAEEQFSSLRASGSVSKASRSERVLYEPVLAQALRERLREYPPLEGRVSTEGMDERKKRRIEMAREVVKGEVDVLKKVLAKAEAGMA